ncbi:PleD family two-component system response regulator [Desulfoscipio sp. XC116]|uniref:GGDEF domain-containing response regulator n=1 Tax=Desulfoscipio sp. XC116 TaxID=3144975 RepID=UPI00325B43C0
MSILIVDDSPTISSLIKSYLINAGYTDLLFAASAKQAFQMLGVTLHGKLSGNFTTSIDLILLDIVLPDMDGREVCGIIKSIKHLQDTPIIIVTSLTDSAHLEMAFAAGATDYVTKPVNYIELLARISSALKLKHEMDHRKAREKKLLEVTRQLEKAVNQLNRLSSLDGLTGIANRRRFDEYLHIEWRRNIRNARPLSLFMADIDFFKAYNDTYGHQAGDECLKSVAKTLKNTLQRPGDLVCRYGGEEFAIILPETPSSGALSLANKMCLSVEALGINHQKSPAGNYVTISIGVATTLPTENSSPKEIIAAADQALYNAKHNGRNQVYVGRSGNTTAG